MKDALLDEASLLFRVATGLFLLWAAIAVVVGVAAFVLAIGGERNDQSAPAALVPPTVQAAPTATPTSQPEPARPSAVPSSAQLVTSDVELGQPSGAPSATPEAPRIFYALSCRDHLLTVATTRETIYAELPCDQYPQSDDVVRPYLGEPVRVLVTTQPQTTLIIQVISPSATQFAADRVWIEPR
jgi:hypothetical protein